MTALICTLNEAENLPQLLLKIPDWVDDILIVDGHSQDRTIAVVQQILPRAKIVFQPGKGKGDALRCGFSEAKGDIIVTLSADLETNPEEIPASIDPLLNGYEFTKGTRFSWNPFHFRGPAGKPAHRIFGNVIIALVFDVLFFKPFTDMCSGYNAFLRESIRKVTFLSEDGYEDEPLLISVVAKAGLKMKEVYHEDGGRIAGEAKSPAFRQGFKSIITIMRQRFMH